MQTYTPTYIASIVIPVYNVEPYINICMKTLSRCNLQDIELLIVNDGSTDNSGEICKSYRENFPVFSYYEKKNGGLSDARNYGINTAKGDYIIFIDSDDFVDSQEFELFLLYLRRVYYKRPDVIFNDFIVCDDSGSPLNVRNQISGEHGNEYLKQFLKKKGNYFNVWRHIFKREFLEINNIKFRSGCYCEDVEFMSQVLMLSGDFLFIHMPYYCYRRDRTGSIMSTVSRKRIQDLLLALNTVYNHNKGENDIKVLIEKKLKVEFLYATSYLFEVSLQERKELIKQYEEMSYLLPFRGSVILYGKAMFMLKKMKRTYMRWKEKKSIKK